MRHHIYLALILCLMLPGQTDAAQDYFEIDRAEYKDRLHGFWLGQSIANWTGLISEGDRHTAPFYTDENWGQLDKPNTWGGYKAHSSRLDFYLLGKGQVWGADDDTDIEYIYQSILESSPTVFLSGQQIREGWLKHIWTNEDAPISPEHFGRENFLWVSNETALYLMKDKGLVPPATGQPEHNPNHDMIDAQLTTEIFGLFAPGRPEIALKMSNLPVRVTASGEASEIAEFYIVMHALAADLDPRLSIKEKTLWLASKARERLSDGQYPAAMYDFIWDAYKQNPNDWAATRDRFYQAFQIEGTADYQYKQLFDAGINFGASLISLFYGEGDFKETIRIGTLAGWDSDNPTATWGGLLGFILGKEQLESLFPEQELSELYWISRTRKGFPDRTPNQIGEDTFSFMADRGANIVERVLQEAKIGEVNNGGGSWRIFKGSNR